MKKSSLCGLGRAAPNPVLSTLNHYRDEYLAHVQEKRCPAKKCVALLHYEIDEREVRGLHGLRSQLPGQLYFRQPARVSRD